jgi:plasmid maintenance system antidote protein VapI
MEVSKMRLSEFLQENKMKPTAFAEKIGMPSTVITRYLKGETQLSMKNAAVIVDRTFGKVTWEDLFKGESNGPNGSAE